MSRTIVLVILILFILGLGTGGFFYWRSQAEVRELNRGLPDGVKVEKSLFGNEYRVVNEIDGYSFKIPSEWKGVKKIKYYDEEEANGISLENLKGNFIGIGAYNLERPGVDLESWVKDWMQKFKTLAWKVEKEKIGKFEVMKLKEEKHLAGSLTYFFSQTPRIYEISGFQGFIREIILNGKW